MRSDDFVSRNLDVRTRSGDEWLCLCPYHADTSPSFSVNIRLNVFICFACGAKGTMGQLAEYLRVGTPDPNTPETESDRLANLSAKVSLLKEAHDVVDEGLSEQYLGRFKHHHPYWSERGLSKGIQDEFELGYDPMRDHGIIPLRAYNGSLLGVIRRQLAVDAVPRYLYPKGFKISQHLFGANKAMLHSRIAIVEGSLDCIACWDVGIPAVALLGSRLSRHQEFLLKTVGADFMVVMTDNDAAGKSAAAMVKEAFRSRVLIGRYENDWEGKDPADLSPAERRVMFDTAR